MCSSVQKASLYELGAFKSDLEFWSLQIPLQFQVEILDLEGSGFGLEFNS